MNTRSINFKINSRIIAVIICVFGVLGYFSIQASGQSVLEFVRELLEKNLKDQIEFINARYTSLDNMGMAQDEDAVAKFQKQIFEKLKSFKYKNTGSLSIIDESGKVLMQSKPSMVKDISKYKFFKDIKADGRGMISYQFSGNSRTAVFDRFDKWKWIVLLEMDDNEIYAPIHALAWSFAVICFTALCVIAVIFFLGTSFGITKPINKIISDLLSGAQITSKTANQVSSLTQQLSHGATQQAVSLEETSSSLDEMSSMTRQNAEYSANANKLAYLAKEQAEKGAACMMEIRRAMEDINDSSQKMSKIIKTIEEIALQTNLLALNAAVEAARAGENGKSFAVVASEVRKLALRASMAAKDTAALIESNVHSTNNGAEIVHRSSEVLVQIMDSTHQVANIINSISSSSKEQAEGISQITNTVYQIDQVTQQTAVSAKQGVGASEELSKQAEGLKETALSLKELISGESRA